MGQSSRIEFILTAVDKGLSTGLNRALGQIRSIGGEAKNAGSGVDSLSTSLGGLVAKVGGVASVVAGIQKLVSVSREFDKISAGLITATGSAEGAESAFAAIQDFATETPYDLGQVSEAFVKLVNLGLTPSERALTSYGNTSAALGKDLNQMVEAVADAATGEFERLKEFGIKSKQLGDQVTFTFKGVSTTVGKNAKEIEDYLIKLGETNFGDAMENRMKTLDGALSNLGDEWDKVFLNISKAGIGDIIAKGVRVAIDALADLNAMIQSGELEGYLEAQIGRWKSWADDVTKSIAIVRDFFRDEFASKVKGWGAGTVDFLITAFKQFPENVRAFVGLTVVSFAAAFDKMVVRARAFKDAFKAIFTSDTIAGVRERMEAELRIIDEAQNASIDAILAERDAGLKSTKDRTAAARELRKEHDAANEASKADKTDRLAQYKAAGAGQEKPGASGGGSDAKAAEKAKKDKEKADKEAAAQAKKDAEEWQKLVEEDTRLVTEKYRALEEQQAIVTEIDQMEASKHPTALARAEAEVAIQRKAMLEKIALKRREVDDLRAIDDVDPAEIERAETELAEARMAVSRAELDGQRTIAAARLSAIESSWRLSADSVELYKRSVADAYALGLMETEEYNERMIAAGGSLTDGLRLGFKQAMQDMKTDAEIMIEIGQQIPDRLADGLTDVFRASVQGYSSMKAAVADWALSTLDWLAQVIIRQAILNALMASGLGSIFGGGGAQAAGQAGAGGVALADGGPVPGYSPTPWADNIRAWLTAKEYVHPVRAVDHYGLPFMESVRRLKFPRHVARALAGATLPSVPISNRLAGGGMAQAQPAMTVKAGDTRLRVVNVIDKNMVGDFLRSSDGETAIINTIRRNGTVIRTILG